MNIPIPEKWKDLPQITTQCAPLIDDLGQCAILEREEDRIALLLPADGLVALIDAPTGPTSTDLRIALGRVVAAHARKSSAPLRLDVIAFEELQPDGLDRGITFDGANMEGWIATVAPDFQQCRLKVGGEAALVFLLRDGALPLAWAHFSTPEPADAILLATADLLIAHCLACSEERKL